MVRIALLIHVLLLPSGVWACWCGMPPPLTRDILKQYPYVALVKVKTMDQLLRPVKTPKPQSREGRFTVDVLESFRNPLPDTLTYPDFNTSCDDGLRPGQTWIIFGRVFNGQVFVDACGYSQRYDRELERGSGYHVRDRIGDELLNSLRQFTGRPIQATDNKIERFYPNGQRSLLTTYRRGGAEEERTVWYANGKLAGKESYRNGAIDGRAKWWFADGNPMVDETFSKGIAVDTSRRWYNTDTDTLWLQSTPSLTEQARDSIIQFNSKSHLQRVTIADQKGQLLNSRNYDWYGRLADETISVPETGIKCRTAYDKQGQINFLLVMRTVVTPRKEPTQQPLYRVEYEPDGSRQVAYYDAKGRLTRLTSVKNGLETVLEEKHYPD